jgi:TPR repeat protein
VKRALLLAALFAAGTACAQSPARLAEQAARGDVGALQQLEKRAASGDAQAEHFMGRLYLVGRGVPKDEARAVEWFRRAAAQGDAASAHNLGVIHERATGALRDRAEALKWYRLGAERGFARSQANLGQLLMEEKDPEARGWIEKAAAQKEPRGIYLLGMLHLQAKDEVQAVALLRQAAMANDQDAQYQLALAYGSGIGGVDKDHEQALRWLRRAADARQADAQYLLAAAYSRGDLGLPRDHAAAAQWLRRSARQGKVEAQYELAIAYAEGRGVPLDPNEALGWILLAAKNNHPGAAAALERIKTLQAREAEKRPPAR